MGHTPARRDVLHAMSVTGVATLAGCSSVTGVDSTADDGSGSGESTADGEPTYTPVSELSPPDSLEDWLSDANGYEGERKRTGTNGRAELRLGREYDDGLGFSPVVIEVPPMTNVRWNWTGHGGAHNVAALDGTFDSGRPNAQSGTSYHYVFEEPGTYPFVSEPDREDGMKGAVVVKEPPSTGYEAVDEWVVHSDNFDGSIADETDDDAASVAVGAEGNGGHLAFDPPVLKVSPGTTVVWEWTGEGGSTNVAFEDLDVRSGDPTADPETTFEHAFEEPGTYRYSSLPHEAIGMRGAVIVE
ncbi:halocyanin domain-containing protein [Halorubrum sp. 48-1-W]|uniref:halocyanin domain-containing protein n=1 Tax=Halorubrum sp. 48-1-W TaxID=2249761 RepID=UPI000DCD4923|nr:halocyanin domain-containing protein [Halorubrum sp. 48-1-W]RAW45909.1 halocyanin domain-containing protein [Halorubrum sp. 48-1-W]